MNEPKGHYPVEKSFFANQSYPKGSDGYNTVETFQIQVLRIQYKQPEPFDGPERRKGKPDRRKPKALSPFDIAKGVPTAVLEGSPAPRIIVRVMAEVVSPDTAFEVDSLGHAEHLFLNMQLPEGRSYYLKEERKHLTIRINQCSSRLAMCNRRTHGTEVIFHPDNEHLLDHTKTTMEGSYIYWPTKNCPKDKIVILAKGKSEADSGYIFAETGLKSYLWEMKDREDCLGNAFDYVDVVNLKKGDPA